MEAFDSSYIPPINLDVYGEQGEYMDTQVAECNADYCGLDSIEDICPLKEIEYDSSLDLDPFVLLDKLCLKLWSEYHKTV